MFAGRESPWKTLGLESGTATLRDVKRAYAALLKKHRPDSDPEGFRRIHDAYEAVLHELKLRDSPQGAEPEPYRPSPIMEWEAPQERREAPAPALAPEKSMPLPVPFLAAFEKLRAARDAGTDDGVADALSQLRLVCGGDPELWRAWSRTLLETFSGGLADTPVAKHLTLADVLAELRAGSDEVAGQLLEGWHRARRVALMTSAGRELTAAGAEKEFDHPCCGRFALRLAFLLAIAQPGGANLLLDAAFRWLPPQMRSQLMPKVDSRLHNARIFWHIPATWHPFWERVMDELDSGSRTDWESTEAKRAIQDLLRVTPADWPGWGFLESQLPPRQWQDILSYFNTRPVSRRQWPLPPAKAWLNEHGTGGHTGPGIFKKAVPEEDWEIPVEAAAGRTIEPESKAAPQAEPPPDKKHEPAMNRKSRAPREAAPTGRSPRGRHRPWRTQWQYMDQNAKLALGCLIVPAAIVLVLIFSAGIVRLIRERAPAPAEPPPVMTAPVITVPDEVFLSRIESITGTSPMLQLELDIFLKTGPAEQLATIESTPLNGTAGIRPPLVLVCAILHPKAAPGIKEAAINRIRQMESPMAALNLLQKAIVSGAPLALKLEEAILDVYHRRGGELPEAVRHELHKRDEAMKAFRSNGGKQK